LEIDMSTKTHLVALSPERHRSCAALVRKGRNFMRAQQAYVRDPECLTSMIMGCIAEGARTRDDIVRNVPRFVGHGYAHVAGILDHHCGPDPAEHLWYRDEAKVYHLHLATRQRTPPVYLKIGSSKRTTKPKPKPQFIGDDHFF
jgi:hypothetical protein